MELLRDGEKSVGELAAEFDVARPAISRHLRILREAGLVQSRLDHNVRYYSLRQPEIDRLRDSLVDAFHLYWAPQGAGSQNAAKFAPATSRRHFVEVRVSTLLPVSVEQAYAYATEQDLFREWVGPEGTQDPRVGGRLSWVSDFGGLVEAEYLALSPPLLNVVRIVSPLEADENFYMLSFMERDGGTHCELRHFVIDPNVAAFLESAWADAFTLLKQHISEKSS